MKYLNTARIKANSTWISDTHLGNPSSHVEELNYFLKKTKTKKIYLVGDIIDTGIYSLNYSEWPENHKQALQLLIQLGKSSEVAVYVKGNHDNDIDKDITEINEINELINVFDIKKDDIYHSIKGDNYYVMHGHQVDEIKGSLSPMLTLFAFVYRKLSFLKIARTIKSKFKGTIADKSGYPGEMVKIGKQKGCDGVITGHIHKPMIKTIEGSTFINCGDWTGNNSAIIESEKGEFKVII